MDRFQFLQRRHYASHFDPWALEEGPVVSDVVDDLLDIYLELKNGLATLEAVGWREAAWHWRESFVSHWGRHAVSALSALHNLVLAEGLTEALECASAENAKPEVERIFERE